MTGRRSVGAVVALIAAAAVGFLACLWWQADKTQKAATNAVASSASTNAANAQIRPPPATNDLTGRPATAIAPGVSAPAAVPANSPSPSPLVPADQNVRPPEQGFPRPVQTVFELQVALARRGLSCGSIDGLMGPQTRAALEAFQRREHLPLTAQLDSATHAALLLTNPPLTEYQVASNDLARLQPLSPTWLGKSQQSALDYESLLELVSEKSQAHPELIRRLNPNLDWPNAGPGTVVQVPNVGYSPLAQHAAFLTIQLEARVLEAWDADTNLLAHFPCSIGRLAQKRPVGELHVAVIVLNPNYTFDPENFPESEEARDLKTKLVLPPGPNNPVGTAWIGLDRPGYGIHGTPRPEQVGRTESHGCFRLANWNAEYLARAVVIGTPVYVQP